MALTPLEIRKQEFDKRMRGYDPEEVRAFLEKVAQELQARLEENLRLSERVKELDAKIEDYRRMEVLLRDTLTTAERTAQEAKRQAEREAEGIREQARVEAERILAAARAEEIRLRHELGTLEGQRLGLISELRGVIQSYLKVLDRLERGGLQSHPE